MAERERSAEDPESATAGNLERVIELELGIEAALARTRAEAHRMLEEARSRAREREREVEAEIAQAGRELRSEAERQRQEAIREIVESARNDVARLDAVTGEQTRELAAWVVRRVIEDER